MIERTGLHNRQFRSVMSFMVGALMIGSISYLGLHTYKDSHAATGASMYVSPDTATVSSGSTVSVTIREDSGSEQVNSVQASLNYDANKLQFVSLIEGGTFPVVAATSTGTPGVIRVGRANADASVSGDHPVVTVNFKVTGASGAAAVSFDKAFSFLVRSSDSHDILQNVGTGSYTIAGGATTSTTRPIMFISPASGSFATGATIAVGVRLNSYDTPVTTVESAISYPANQLQYLNVSEGGTYTTKQRTNNANGIVDVIRGIAGGSSGIQGDNPVVTINFKVIGANGTAGLTIGGASAAYDASGTGQNILNASASTGASYTVLAGATTPNPAPTPAPAPAPTPAPTPAPSTGSTNAGTTNVASSITSPSQALMIGSSGGNSRVALTTDDSGAVLTELGGQVNLAPIFDPAVFAKNPNDTVAKVEYYLDGKLVSTHKTTPFTYKFDSNALRNGTYTMAIKTYYSSGTVDTRTDKLLVKNKVTLGYVMRHFLVNIIGLIAILAVLVALMWKLVIPRFTRAQAPVQATDHDALYGFGSTFGPSKNQPVAGDPTLVTPSSGSSDIVSVPSASSIAAQTTEALPIAGAGYSSTKQVVQSDDSKAVAPAQMFKPDVAPPTIVRPRSTAIVNESQPVSIPATPAPTPTPVTANTFHSAERSTGIAPPTNRF